MRNTERLYEVLAEVAEKYIQQRIREGATFVAYSDLYNHLGIDRYSGAQVLGRLIGVNCATGSPLWSSLVAYMETNQERGMQRGMCGESFWTAAAYYGYAWNNKLDFLNEQRQACERMLRDAG